MLPKSTLWVAALTLLLASTSSTAAAPAPGKSVYSLSSRTPESYLRDLSTDRPDLTEQLGFYLELTSTLTRSADLASFDCGLTYGVNRHLQLDVGANLSLTRATEDLTVFAGLSVRF